jgi:hypothetical protein
MVLAGTRYKGVPNRISSWLCNEELLIDEPRAERASPSRRRSADCARLSARRELVSVGRNAPRASCGEIVFCECHERHYLRGWPDGPGGTHRMSLRPWQPATLGKSNMLTSSILGDRPSRQGMRGDAAIAFRIDLSFLLRPCVCCCRSHRALNTAPPDG